MLGASEGVGASGASGASVKGWRCVRIWGGDSVVYHVYLFLLMWRVAFIYVRVEMERQKGRACEIIFHA